MHYHGVKAVMAKLDNKRSMLVIGYDPIEVENEENIPKERLKSELAAELGVIKAFIVELSEQHFSARSNLTPLLGLHMARAKHLTDCEAIRLANSVLVVSPTGDDSEKVAIEEDFSARPASLPDRRQRYIQKPQFSHA